ncbi:hypothetical protein, partial [Escherichia coli]
NDIQIFCAKEFAQAMIKGKEQIKITGEDSEISKILLQNKKIINEKELFKDSVYFKGKKNKENYNKNVIYSIESGEESLLYKEILDKYSTLLREGRSIKEIQQKITFFLDEFFSVDLNHEIIEKPRNKGIEKLVSKQILE